MMSSNLTSVKSLTEWDSRANGTCLQGYVRGTYDELVSAFGAPVLDGDEYKVDAEWQLLFNDEIIVTLYNYKTGRNYLGAEGLDVEDIECWHVGGKSSHVLSLLSDYFEENDVYLSVHSTVW